MLRDRRQLYRRNACFYKVTVIVTVKHKNIQGAKGKCVIPMNKSRLAATLYKDEEGIALVESGYINTL